MDLNWHGFYWSCSECWNTSLVRGSGPPEDDNTVDDDADSFTGGHLIIPVVSSETLYICDCVTWLASLLP